MWGNWIAFRFRYNELFLRSPHPASRRRGTPVQALSRLSRSVGECKCPARPRPTCHLPVSVDSSGAHSPPGGSLQVLAPADQRTLAGVGGRKRESETPVQALPGPPHLCVSSDAQRPRKRPQLGEASKNGCKLHRLHPQRFPGLLSLSGAKPAAAFVWL